VNDVGNESVCEQRKLVEEIILFFIFLYLRDGKSTVSESVLSQYENCQTYIVLNFNTIRKGGGAIFEGFLEER